MLFATCRDSGAVYKAAFVHQDMFARFINPNRESINLTGWDAWIGDNGAFTGFKQDVFMGCIKKLLPYRAACKCLTVPDVPFHWEPTLEKFYDWSPSIRRMGFPVGLAVQDGATVENIPWSLIDAVFIGGSTQWKRQQGLNGPLFAALGTASPVQAIVSEAKKRGCWVHVGRSANAPQQLWYAYRLGADSVDGTRETFAPDREFRWIAQTMWQIHQDRRVA